MNTTTEFRNFALAVIASASMLSFLAAPAKAASTEVAYASAELASKGGRAAIDARIEAAAERVCAAGGLDRLSLVEMQGYKACVKGTVANASAQLAATRAATMMAAN